MCTPHCAPDLARRCARADRERAGGKGHAPALGRGAGRAVRACMQGVRKNACVNIQRVAEAEKKESEDTQETKAKIQRWGREKAHMRAGHAERRRWARSRVGWAGRGCWAHAGGLGGRAREVFNKMSGYDVTIRAPRLVVLPLDDEQMEQSKTLFLQLCEFVVDKINDQAKMYGKLYVYQSLVKVVVVSFHRSKLITFTVKEVESNDLKTVLACLYCEPKNRTIRINGWDYISIHIHRWNFKPDDRPPSPFDSPPLSSSKRNEKENVPYEVRKEKENVLPMAYGIRKEEENVLPMVYGVLKEKENVLPMAYGVRKEREEKEKITKQTLMDLALSEQLMKEARNGEKASEACKNYGLFGKSKKRRGCPTY
ncbi:hypothetical protein C2S52_019166 [Perilla frutescens var. hirtella]|nr:hypothetical protein C2S52_019166 [Perilla frutescens var. hirtella]